MKYYIKDKSQHIYSVTLFLGCFYSENLVIIYSIYNLKLSIFNAINLLVS